MSRTATLADSAAVPDTEPVEVRRPLTQSVPVVLASPHSGRVYPESFVRESLLDPLTLRRSEDYFVDELFKAGPALGMPLVIARFPRVYCDANREPYELDPQMFEGGLPSFVNTRSVRVACGLGTIARVVSDGAEIYRRRLSFAEAEARVASCYRPYHGALQQVVFETRARFGGALVLDCHSMPSIGGPLDLDAGLGRRDVVLGDRYGTACHPRVIDMVEQVLRSRGFDVGRNAPYAGGHTTQLYGRPARGLQAIQIEINRGLYMDERRIEPAEGFFALAASLAAVLEEVGRRASPDVLNGRT
jgi:N-formylglutamate amidohydrolase